MQILVREGVLTRRAGLGTTVLDPHANHTAVWTIGMTFPPKVESGVSPTVSFLLRQQLHRNDCEDLTYCAATPVPTGDPRPIDVFPGLADDLTCRLDAVLTTMIFEYPDDALVVSVGGLFSPLAVYIDYFTWACDALQRLAAQGCRRIGLLGSETVFGEETQFHKAHRHLRRQGVPLEDPLVMPRLSHIEGGCEAAEMLLAMPDDRRPDALLVADDYHCMGLTGRLAVRGTYRPKVAVQVNRQLRLMFSMPVFRYALDLEEMARRSVDLMVRQLEADKPLGTCHEPVVPTLLAEQPDY